MEERLHLNEVINIIQSRLRLSSLSDQEICDLFNNYIAISTEGLQETLTFDNYSFILKTEQFD